MNSVEIMTLITGVFVLGFLTGIYLRFRLKKRKITKFIVKGSKDIKRLHYILKSNKFKIIDVNKNFKYKILINNNETRYSFSVPVIAKRKRRKYICFLPPEGTESIDHEILFKTKILNLDRGLMILPDTFKFYEYRIKK
ncbi:MAG: hypothetical protein KKH98_14100 [Spirochaetes bacterium]|nr:hypothetical protein [Spirochaetota bacterium]